MAPSKTPLPSVTRDREHRETRTTRGEIDGDVSREIDLDDPSQGGQMSAVAGDQTLTKRQERLFGIIEKVSQILEGSPSNAGTHTEIQASREQLPATTDGRNVEPYTPMRRWKEETFADQSFHGLRN